MGLGRIIKKEGFVQFIKFCIVGVIGVSFNYSIFFILFHFFKVFYIVSSASGFILGIFLVFFLNKKFTFKITSTERTKSMMAKYFLVNIVSTLIGLSILYVLVDLLHMNTYLSNVLILGVTTLINFFGSKFFSFKV